MSKNKYQGIDPYVVNQVRYHARSLMRHPAKTTVYVRKSGKRLPLKMLYGPGIMQLFRQRENDQIMQAKVQERFEPEFNRNLAFYLNRYKQP